MTTKLKFYVNDTSKVLSSPSQKRLDALFKDIDSKSGLQAVTVLFPHRKWRELRNIALETFNSNKIGQKGKNNGLLLIIATDEKKIRIMTGKWLEWIYSQSWCKHVIQTKLRPLLESGKYEELIEVWHQEVQKNIQIINSPFAAIAPILYGVWAFFMIPFFIGFSIMISNIFSSSILAFLLWLFLVWFFTIFRWVPKWIKIFIIVLSLASFFFAYGIERNKIYCENNPIICEERRIEAEKSRQEERENRSYDSYDNSSDNDWWSSSSWDSSPSFGGWGGSSNGGGWWD